MNTKCFGNDVLIGNTSIQLIVRCGRGGGKLGGNHKYFKIQVFCIVVGAKQCHYDNH